MYLVLKIFFTASDKTFYIFEKLKIQLFSKYLKYFNNFGTHYKIIFIMKNIKRLNFAIALGIIFLFNFSACQVEPVASFTASKIAVEINETITFTNTSKDGDSYEWDFGDGSTKSTENSPSYSYSSPGSYTVTLTVFSKNGKKSDKSTVMITVGLCPQTVSYENYTYNIVQIGEQCWFAENLRYLPSVSGPASGSNTEPYYYVYGYTGSSISEAKAVGNYEVFGVLYNWSAAMAGSNSSDENPSGVQGICPEGWHFPSRSEWTQLIDYLDGSMVAGGKLKEEGTVHWNDPNIGATNSSGFTAFGGGYRHWDGTFKGYRTNGSFWSSTDLTTNPDYPSGSYLSILASSSQANQTYMDKNVGMFVRCVKD